MYRNYSLSTHTKSNRFFGKINLWISQKKKKVKLFRHNWRRPRFLNSDFVFRIRPFFLSSFCVLWNVFVSWRDIPLELDSVSVSKAGVAWHAGLSIPINWTSYTSTLTRADDSFRKHFFHFLSLKHLFHLFGELSKLFHCRKWRILTKYQICQDFYSSHQSGSIHFK